MPLPGTSSARPLVAMLVIAAALLGGADHADARPIKKRFGWQNFTARYKGGYNVGGPVGAAAGPASIRIRASRDGRSARVNWRNTFYTSGGSYVIAMNWDFRRDGTVVTSTLDPRVASRTGTGTFEVVGNRPVKFTVRDTSGTVTATGQFRLIGGGALGITITLVDPAEGETFLGFTGGRRR